MSPNVVLVSLLLVLLSESALHAQTLTYSLEGALTSVPPCVMEVFSEGDRWTLEQVIDLPSPEEEAETAGADGADATIADSISDNDTTNPDDPAAVAEEFTLTQHHPASAFSWSIGDVSGTTRGVTRIFVSNDHLGQDSITWQALDYSAAFTPSGLGAVGIRGIQAGLADRTSAVFESTDVPEVIDRARFAGEGFFQVLFQTPCGHFRRHTPLTGSVSSVQLRWEPAR